MKHICPECGFEYTGDLDKCPNCGYEIAAAKSETEPNQSPDTNKTDEGNESPSTAATSQTETNQQVPEDSKKEQEHITSDQQDTDEDGADKVLNDDIQWSDYEEMPIGSVAELLNESLDDHSDGAKTGTSETEASTDENKGAADSQSEKSSDEKTETEAASSETTVKAPSDSSSSTDEAEENRILSQYLESHRQEEIDAANALAAQQAADSKEENQTEEKTESASSTQAATDTADNINTKNADADQQHTAAEDQPLDPNKPYEPLDLFVLDGSDASHDNGQADDEFVHFDDPNLEPLPSEDEKVAAKYAKTFSFDESAQEKTEVPEEHTPEAPNEEVKAAAKEPQPAAEKPAAPKKTSSSRKWLYIGAAALILAGAGGLYVYQQHQDEADRQAVAQKKTSAALDDLKIQLAAFYTDDSQVFLKADAVSSDLSKIQDDLDKYKDESAYKSLKTTADDISSKLKWSDQVNALFTTPVITGDKLSDTTLLKADQKITLGEMSGDDGFAKLVNQAIGEAQTQYDTLQTAKEKVEAVYSNDAVNTNITRSAYDAAVSAVSAVKNQELAAALKANLEKVDAALTNAEQASAAQQQAAAGSSSSANANASGNYAVGADGALTGFTMNKTGDPIVASNAADIADSGNAAWTWADGIKDTVIQKCIDRGYITADNYTLEPALIVDGSGFYNLYRTSGTKTYLVTINCKTGWFKGNGQGGPATRVN